VRLRFLAPALFAAFGALGVTARPAPAAPAAQNDRIRLYVGTYTGGASRGIYLLELDRSSGSLASGPVLAGESENPSFLALHPSGRFLYSHTGE
jgi:6-phosphogluconolactonase